MPTIYHEEDDDKVIKFFPIWFYWPIEYNLPFLLWASEFPLSSHDRSVINSPQWERALIPHFTDLPNSIWNHLLRKLNSKRQIRQGGGRHWNWNCQWISNGPLKFSENSLLSLSLFNSLFSWKIIIFWRNQGSVGELITPLPSLRPGGVILELKGTNPETINVYCTHEPREATKGAQLEWARVSKNENASPQNPSAYNA